MIANLISTNVLSYKFSDKNSSYVDALLIDISRTANQYLLPEVCCTKVIQKRETGSRFKPLHLIKVTQPLVQVDATLEPQRLFIYYYFFLLYNGKYHKSQNTIELTKVIINITSWPFGPCQASRSMSKGPQGMSLAGNAAVSAAAAVAVTAS